MDTPTDDEIDRLLATYGPNRPPAYAVLRPCVDLIRALRHKGASFETVRQILRVRGITVSESSVRNFCREILGEGSTPPRARRRRSQRIDDSPPPSVTPSAALPEASSSTTPEPPPSTVSEAPSVDPHEPPTTTLPVDSPRPRGPRIANLKRLPSTPS